jgi:hypothetical protein
MFTSIRKYKVKRGSADELARRVRDGFVPLMRQMEGFKGGVVQNLAIPGNTRARKSASCEGRFQSVGRLSCSEGAEPRPVRPAEAEVDRVLSA